MTTWGSGAIAAFMLFVGGSVFISAPVFAQEADPAAAAQGVIEEIIVTSRRREENLQEVPLSAAVFTAEDLQTRMIYNIEDLGEFVPNVTMTTGAAEGTNIVIRGIGTVGMTDSRVPSRSSLYIDGVYVPSTQGASLSTLDVERTEVIRGPQGTMFGMNTTGGAVNVITRRPGPDVEASAILRVGEFEQRDARLSVNVPIIDGKLFTRAALALENNDGFYEEVTTGKGYQDKSLHALYTAWRWLLNEHWTLDFTGHYSDNSKSGRGGECNFAGRNRNSDRHESGGGGDYEAACNASKAAGKYRFISDVDGFTDITQTGLFGVATWESNGPIARFDNASVKISTGLREKTFRSLRDLDLSSERLHSIGSFIYPSGEALGKHTETTSLEVLFQGTAIDGRLDFTLGYHYLQDQGSPEGQNCLALYETVIGTGESVTCSHPGGSYIDSLPFNITGRGPTPSGSQVFSEDTSRSVFFHGTFDLSERFFVDFGGRWTSERRIGRAINWRPSNVLAGREHIVNELNDETVDSFEQGDDQWQTFTPMASISRRLSTENLNALDEGIVYFSYSEGSNSGGFNYELPPETLGAFYQYGPENVRAYEVGLKSTWGGGNLRFNVSAFLTDYADKQVGIVAELSDVFFEEEFFESLFVGFVDNIAEVEIYGLEIETQLRTDSGFLFEVAVSSLTNEYSEYNSIDEDLGVPLDLTSLNIDDLTPDYTLSATAQYTLTLGDGSTLAPRLGVYWQDDYELQRNLRKDAPPSQCFKEAYSKLDARLTWQSRDSNRRVAMYGTNITDEEILNSCTRSSITATRIHLNAPARWGIEATFLFGQ